MPQAVAWRALASISKLLTVSAFAEAHHRVGELG
jgi:hypothetical protein